MLETKIVTQPIIQGDTSREAIDSLKGYVYQIYRSALAWIDLQTEEFLFLEVAEDYAVVATDALNAVQVKETANTVTINSADIVATIDSFVDLQQKNPELQVRLRHLTTSKIAKEKSAEHRIDDTPTLESWRKLAKIGDLTPLKKVLIASKLSEKTKNYIRGLDDNRLREEFLKRIHFDCGALDSSFTLRLLRSKLTELIIERRGIHAQVEECLNKILITLLQKVTQKQDRFVDKHTLESLLAQSTHISVNRDQFEAQHKLINQLLATPTSQTTNLISSRFSEPKSVDEVPLPVAMANRTIQINKIVTSLSQHGVCWIFGAAGVGKTIGARIAARHLGGSWRNINLRGLNTEQVGAVLSDAINKVTDQKIVGIIVDDIECLFEPHILDKLLYLHAICSHTDQLLLFTSSRPPSSDFLFFASLPNSIEQKLEEFSEQDIREILIGLSVNNANWVKYIHLISGGGHPQLAIAAIQSMQNKAWDKNELETFDSLLQGNQAIEQVRARTRERLLGELPEGSRRLLERLSLKIGSFRRSFVLDMTQVAPTVSDGGILFEGLIGSWIVQQERDQFMLSPLLSNLAMNTLTDQQKQEVNFEIANSITKSKSLDPIEANSALLAALIGKNKQVIFSLCMGILSANSKDLTMIAPHLTMLKLMRTDAYAYENDPVISQMFRGTQLLLNSQDRNKKEELQEFINCFETESELVKNDTMRDSMKLMVYSKLLLSESKFGAIPNFLDFVIKLDKLLENQNLPPEIFQNSTLIEVDGTPAVSFMFLNQVTQIKLIDELLPVFNFLNSCETTLRQKLLKSFDHPDFGVDTLVSSAWLSEHDAETIVPSHHSNIFATLEKMAAEWSNNDIAVACRKCRAIIVDEYGNDKEQALSILDDGMKQYGETNSVLVRAKAKVLYRSENHQASLELSRLLIDNNIKLSVIEKAFFGREAAISAEKQGDYETARTYYLYASEAAKKCSIPDMVSMRVGLMADAALASWHADDRATCLHDFITILEGLQGIDPKHSARTSHCHAVCRHVLLWLNEKATGIKKILEDGTEVKIYPGIVSNPEPNPKILEREIGSIEIAWYMLAAIENYCCLDVGITKNLDTFLPKGYALEGRFLLTQSEMTKSLQLLNSDLFKDALKETIKEVAYYSNQTEFIARFNINKVTYGSFPPPTLEQQLTLSGLTEQLVLCFFCKCIFAENIIEMNLLLNKMEHNHNFKVRKEFLDCLKSSSVAVDYNTSIAVLLILHKKAFITNIKLLPIQTFELAFHTIQIATKTNNLQIIANSAFIWLCEKWSFIQAQQRFLLKNYSLYEKSISQAICQENGSCSSKAISLLEAMLPVMGYQNESQLRKTLKDLRDSTH